MLVGTNSGRVSGDNAASSLTTDLHTHGVLGGLPLESSHGIHFVASMAPHHYFLEHVENAGLYYAAV